MARPRKQTEAPGLFDEFEFVADLPPSLRGPGAYSDPVQTRREKMVRAIEEQRNLWHDPNWSTTKNKYRDGHKVTIEHKPRAWFKRQGHNVFVTPKYGPKTIELRKGYPTARLNEDQVEPFLAKLRQMVENGDMDDLLAKLASRPR